MGQGYHARRCRNSLGIVGSQTAFVSMSQELGPRLQGHVNDRIHLGSQA